MRCNGTPTLQRSEAQERAHALSDATDSPAVAQAPDLSRDELEQDEFRFAPPLNQPPFVPAEVGTQGLENSAKELGPRFRGDERNQRRYKLISR